MRHDLQIHLRHLSYLTTYPCHLPTPHPTQDSEELFEWPLILDMG